MVAETAMQVVEMEMAVVVVEMEMVAEEKVRQGMELGPMEEVATVEVDLMEAEWLV